MSVAEERKWRRRLLPIAPSAAWVEACFAEELVEGEEGEVVRHVRFARLVPPPADTCPMKLCPSCGRYTPHGYWVQAPEKKRICADCAIEPGAPDLDAWGHPFARVMDVLRASKTVLRWDRKKV